MITASESKAKYGDGTKLIYVKIDGEVRTEKDGTITKGAGKIERITVAEYQRRYTDYAEPPKAAESMQELLGIDDDKNAAPGVKRNEKPRVKIAEYLKLYDKPLKLALYDKKV